MDLSAAVSRFTDITETDENQSMEREGLMEQDDEGVSRIEAFLDRIEDPHESILDSFMDDFAIVRESLGLREEQASKEFLANRAKIAEFEKMGGGEVPVGAKRVSDGFRECAYKGSVECGLPEGPGSLAYTDGAIFTGTFSGGLRHRAGQERNAQGEVQRVEGTWVHGFLEGRARQEYTVGGWREGQFRAGCCHGFARTFGIGSYTTNCLKSFACYNNGVRVGWVYEGLLGGGYLVGRVDGEGELTGPDIAFVYPDFRTALRGEFREGRMVAGHQCRVLSSRQVSAALLYNPCCKCLHPCLHYTDDNISTFTIVAYFTSLPCAGGRRDHPDLQPPLGPGLHLGPGLRHPPLPLPPPPRPLGGHHGRRPPLRSRAGGRGPLRHRLPPDQVHHLTLQRRATEDCLAGGAEALALRLQDPP
jgi:hypothetical protein